jgi:hypothetical protein
LKIKYPSVADEKELQEAWSNASKAIKKAEEVLLNPERELEAAP